MKRTSIYDTCIVVISFLIFLMLLFIYVTVEDLRTENKQLKAESIQYQMNYENLKQDYDELKKIVERYEELVKSSRSSSVNSFTEEEIYMLAQCVEAEAGHYQNHSNSQRYVAQVILNRLQSDKYPNTLKEVIYQKSGKIPQFSVAYNGAMNREVTQETLANVREVLNNGTDLPSNVLFFYSEGVKNNWVNTRPIYKTVEGTVFAY